MYTQTMAARFDCKKLLRFALATLCLLALAMFMPVAVNAADATQGPHETANLTISEGDASVIFKRKGSADERETNTGHASLEVYVLQNDSTTKQLEETKLGETKDFEYQYNSSIDTDLYDHYDNASNSFKKELEGKKDKKHGAGTGGYASLDLGVEVSKGYTLYKVDYTVCHSSEGPKNTGWKTDDTFGTESEVRPTQYYYLDNITDGTTVKVYIMPTYTIQYVVKYGENVIDAANYGTYFTISSGNLANVTGYPQDGVVAVYPCTKLTDKETGMTKENFTENNGNDPAGAPSYTPKIYPYHRWCTTVNETEAVLTAKNAFNYTTTTSVTLPTLTANSGYQVTGWSISGDTSNNTYNGGKEINVATLAPFAIHKDNNNRVITLTAEVTDQVPPSTDDSGNGGTTGGDSGDSGSTGGNTGSGDSGTSGGQESTTTPAPETTPASTPSVTTVTAVAPTATPTATPAPTAEPTATPAPAAVSAHIPQTSDDMPYTLLVVTALASLCAAGAMFKKRRSK